MKRLILLLLMAFPAFAQTPTFTVTLNWTAPTVNAADLAGYKIYWGVTQGGPYPNNATIGLATTHVITNQVLLSDTRYYFVATARDDAGLESVFSNEATATTPDVVPPGPPTNVTVTITFP